MKHKVKYGILILLIVAAIAVPSVLLAQKSIAESATAERANEVQAVIQAFGSQYGIDKQILNVSKPERLYLIYWTKDDILHASLLVDAVWVEIYQGAMSTPVPEVPSGE